MKPEAQRIAIAEACGWTANPFGGLCPPNLHPATNINQQFELPDYLNDLNAMHETEKVLTGNNRLRYCELVASITKHDSMFATAAQRAEAFLRTISKWVEE